MLGGGVAWHSEYKIKIKTQMSQKRKNFVKGGQGEGEDLHKQISGYYKVLIIRDGIGTRNIYQWNRIDSLVVDPHLHGSLIYDKYYIA